MAHQKYSINYSSKWMYVLHIILIATLLNAFIRILSGTLPRAAIYLSIYLVIVEIAIFARWARAYKLLNVYIGIVLFISSLLFVLPLISAFTSALNFKGSIINGLLKFAFALFMYFIQRRIRYANIHDGTITAANSRRPATRSSE